MQFVSIALAAAVAAQSNSGVQWKPLGSSTPVKTVPVAATPAAPTATPAAPDADVATSEAARAPAAPIPAVANSRPKGVVLWRNVEDGMPAEKVRAMFPRGKDVEYKSDRTVLTNVPVIEGCEAKVNILHPGGQVKEIVMRGEGSLAGRCSLKLITALSGKYGEPLEKDKVGGSLLAREGKNYVWARDGLALQFKRYTSGVLGGGGLFAASWELRYSVNPTNIDL